MSTSWTMRRAVSERPPLLHPLAGARLPVFLEKALGNGPYTRRTIVPRWIAGACALLRLPLAGYQSSRMGGLVAGQEIREGPVFIVGHWRSGTTFIHNIMSRDPLFAWLDFVQTNLPSEILIEPHLPFLRALVDRVLPERRGTDNIALDSRAPQEEEWALANLNPLSFFNCYFFPAHYDLHFRRGVLLEKTTPQERESLEEAYLFLARSLHLLNSGKRVLFKNPSATARIALLKRIFPRARFIHIVRNPYEVFASSLARFPRIMSAFAWEPFEDIDFESIVLDSYESLMTRYLEEREILPPGDLVETSYEELVADPVGQVERIYESLGLPIEIEAFERIDAYVAAQRGYERNTHRLSARQADLVRERWSFAFDRWSYELPPGLAPR